MHSHLNRKYMGLCCSRNLKGSWYLHILGQAVEEEFLDCLTLETSGTTWPNDTSLHIRRLESSVCYGH